MHGWLACKVAAAQQRWAPARNCQSPTQVLCDRNNGVQFRGGAQGGILQQAAAGGDVISSAKRLR